MRAKAKSVPKRKAPKKRFLKPGRLSGADKRLINDAVMQTGPITPAKEKALAVITNKSRETIRKGIDEARENLSDHAKAYVDLHMAAVIAGVASEDPKGLDVAIKGSQWAMEKLSLDGSRVIDAPKQDSDRTPKVLIGIQLGGITADPKIVEGAIIKVGDSK
jgi:hypothetical protein